MHIYIQKYIISYGSYVHRDRGRRGRRGPGFCFLDVPPESGINWDESAPLCQQKMGMNQQTNGTWNWTKKNWDWTWFEQQNRWTTIPNYSKTLRIIVFLDESSLQTPYLAGFMLAVGCSRQADGSSSRRKFHRFGHHVAPWNKHSNLGKL